MKNSFNNILNGGVMISEYRDGLLIIIITTICWFMFIIKGSDTIVNRIPFGSQVCFAPFNCFAYDGPNLMSGNLGGWGL